MAPLERKGLNSCGSENGVENGDTRQRYDTLRNSELDVFIAASMFSTPVCLTSTICNKWGPRRPRRGHSQSYQPGSEHTGTDPRPMRIACQPVGLISRPEPLPGLSLTPPCEATSHEPHGIHVHQARLLHPQRSHLGLWLRLVYSGYATLVPNYSFASADSLLLAAGCVTFVIAFFGCCGAWFQSRCMLITYFGLVILMFLGEFMLGTLAFVFREHLAKSLKDELLFGIEKHYNITSEPGTLPAIWDNIQSEFHCCGVRDYTDWFRIDAWPTEDRVPSSCCVQRVWHCGRLDPEGKNKELWYKEGCATAIQMWLVTRLHVVGTVGLVVAFLQLFGQVASMILFCTVRHKRSSHTYKSYDTTNT
ncbi:Tetraspanin-9 [Eufriesea mexicana]|nr:Tetraspanin-9 [Eufriesea mexicana]